MFIVKRKSYKPLYESYVRYKSWQSIHNINVEVEFLCHYVEKNEEKSLLHVIARNYKEALLYIGGSFIYCLVEAQSTKQIWEARVCMAKAHGVQGFPLSCNKGENVFYGIKPNFAPGIGKDFKSLLEALMNSPNWKVIFKLFNH